MNKKDVKYDHLERHNKRSVLDMSTKMTKDIEKLLDQKEFYEKKLEAGVKREQAKSLRYQKVKQKIRDERHNELVTIDRSSEAINEFDQIYDKLMGDKDDKPLPEKYIGKKMLACESSLNALSRIKEKYDPMNGDKLHNKSTESQPSQAKSKSKQPNVIRLNTNDSNSSI